MTQEARRSLRQAGTYVRENPLPTILGALTIGFAIGLLVRMVERENRAKSARGKLHEAEEYLRSILEPVATKSKRAYAKSAGAVRDAVDDAVHRAKDLDVSDYTGPVVGWWQKVLKKF